MTDPYEQGLRDKIARDLDEKQFAGYWDNRRKDWKGTKGRETWIHDGKSQVTAVTINRQGEGIGTLYIATITVRLTARFERKTFKGIGSEYNREEWRVEFDYNLTYTMGMGISRVSDVSISNSVTAADHDAVQWAADEFSRDVAQNLAN